MDPQLTMPPLSPHALLSYSHHSYINQASAFAGMASDSDSESDTEAPVIKEVVAAPTKVRVSHVGLPHAPCLLLISVRIRA